MKVIRELVDSKDKRIRELEQEVALFKKGDSQKVAKDGRELLQKPYQLLVKHLKKKKNEAIIVEEDVVLPSEKETQILRPSSSVLQVNACSSKLLSQNQGGCLLTVEKRKKSLNGQETLLLKSSLYPHPEPPQQ